MRKTVKLTVRLLISLIWLTTLILPGKTQPTSILELIQKEGVIKVGLREDAVPFGYRDLNGNLTGLCLNFIELLRRELRTQLGKRIISIQLFKSTLFNRFELIEDKIIYLECGPNSINTNKKTVDFSEPFFLTGSQLLVNQSDSKKINLNGTLKGVIIGVLHNTSNQEFLMNKYPEATLREFQGITGRRRGIQALQQGRINAFASDGILLIGEAVLQGLAVETDYRLIPSPPFACEYYGLILPKDDPAWRNLVNSAIEKGKSSQIFKKWLGVVLPQIEPSSCPAQSVEISPNMDVKIYNK